MANSNVTTSYKGWVIGLLSLLTIVFSGALTERLMTRGAEVNFREKMYEYIEADHKFNTSVTYQLQDLENRVEVIEDDVARTKELMEHIRLSGCRPENK